MTLVYDYTRNPLPYGKRMQEIPAGESFDFRYYACFCGSDDEWQLSNTTRHCTKLNIVQCQRCGTLRINPYMSDESIGRYYSEIYRDVKHKERTPETTFLAQQKYSSDAYRFIAPHLSPGMRILDYGCASGGRMAPFLDAGYEVSGFDLDEEFVAYAISRGVKRYVETEKYDLIFFSHVIEHTNDPVATLREVTAKNLSETGLIYITVPLIDQQGGAGSHSDLLSEIHLAHKYYFTRPSLTLLAALVGFAPVAENRNHFLFRATPDVSADIQDPALMRVSHDVLQRARRQLRRWQLAWFLKAIKQTTRRRLGLSSKK